MRSVWLGCRSNVSPPLWLLRLRHPVHVGAHGGHAIRRCSRSEGVVSTCAMRVSLRWHGTTTPPSASPEGSSGAVHSVQSAAAHNDEEEASFSRSFRRTFRTVRLHNMPRTWLHEEVMQFLHQVAEHAGIEPPPEAAQGNGTEERANGKEQEEEEEEDMTSAVPHVTSPFVARMHIPFGRRTGIVCGSPIIKLTSDALAGYLLNDLNFEPDDYRSRIYFTEVLNDKHHEAKTMVNKDEAALLKMEQQEALESLELDRYLMAPDLLYDIAKMRQRRLVTRRSKLLLHTFADDDSLEEGEDGKDQSEEKDDDSTNENKRVRSRKHKKSKKTLRCVGEYKELGRGSVHSVPLAMPYVQGRRGV
ncbi:hypothetical protein MOQ_008135 [Trypanosoma cruzi marinkellei]|uniref:CRIB domain-containing protein n=1 Tax=Trypanosoma cruzi marinkellei TaxID=85056 RepID=K2LZR6_TRYCR|nr:hypothetical protein MOQ_008135 [Trypanosoma cruzi marinkellei]